MKDHIADTGQPPMKRLFGFMGKKRQSAIALSAVLAVLSTALGLVPYLIVYLIAEKVLGNESGWLQSQSYVVLGIIALVSILGKGWFYAWSTRAAHMTAFPVLYDIRLLLARKLAALPLGYFHIRPIGEMKELIDEKVERLEQGMAHFIPEMMASTAVPFLTALTMLLIDWRMGLAALLYAPLVYFSFKWVVGRLGVMMPEFQRHRMNVMNMILQYVYGMKVIKAFARTEENYDAFRQVVEKASREMLRINLRIRRYQGVVVGFSRAGLLFVIPLGIWLYSNDSLSIATFVFFVLMTLSFGKTIFNVIHAGAHALDVVKHSMDSITAFLQEKSLTEPERPIQPTGSEICFDGVDFSYDGKRNVLNQLSFTAREGQVTAIVGASGSGKSTIVRLANRFWDTNNGSITIGGIDVKEMGSSVLVNQVSSVFQEVFLFNDTVLENIRIGKPAASDEEIIEAAKAACCHDFIMALPQGYMTKLGEHGGRLSGGQRQRISIARAILKDAPILLLDEATAYVDAENEARIQEALSALIRPHNGKQKTLLVVAHRLGTIKDADQIVVVQEGTVEATGKHHELLAAQGRYARMWQAAMASDRGLSKSDWAIPQPQQQRKPSAASLHMRNAKEKDSSTVSAETEYTKLGAGKSYWRMLMSLAGSERGRLLRACLFPLVAAPFIAMTTWSMMSVIRALMVDRIGEAWIYAGVLLLCLSGQVALTIASFRSFERYDNAVEKQLRIYLGRHLRRLPMGFFLQRDAATLQQRLTADITGLSVYDSIGSLVRGIAAPALLFIGMLWLDWRLALCAILAIPPYLWMTRGINRLFDKSMLRQQQAKEKAGRQILEYVQGIPVIRSFAAGDLGFDRYAQAMAEYRDANMAVQNRITPYQFWYGSIFEVSFAGVLLFGSALYAENALAGTTMLLFMIVMLGFFEPIPLLDYTFSRRNYMAAAKRVSEVLEAKPLKEPDAGQESVPNGFAIELNGVSFGYDQHTAGKDAAGEKPLTLKGISLSIPERSITALVGPSGGGKTTLLHLIARFWDIQKGSISIGGADIREMSMDTLMTHISVVFQDVYLFHDTIENNIRFGRPEATDEEVVRAAQAAQCHDFISALPDGYKTLVGEGGSTLSGGEKQRISIARAILKDAPIVLLDEATSSLDPENDRDIQAALLALSANKTLIVVAHRLHTIQHADQIVVLDQGKVIQRGTHQELAAEEGLYRRFYEDRNQAQQWRLNPSSDKEEARL
ncbi:ABC transporter ATP-binding protein [Paenibacillus gorillae]|uniref:ABC transporter ATP-binding protein n=1 Tax=Paenibacillus gorillae TaxID=1243662 RepID=UPI0004B71287|nr:ABC transporter ATP-binding protein [Paenibacillus gorillae]